MDFKVGDVVEVITGFRQDSELFPVGMKGKVVKDNSRGNCAGIEWEKRRETFHNCCMHTTKNKYCFNIISYNFKFLKIMGDDQMSFSKKDIQNGDIVEYRDGERRYVFKLGGQTHLMTSSLTSGNLLDNYQENLRENPGEIKNNTLDIVKVYRTKNPDYLKHLSEIHNYSKLIYEETKPVIELSLEDIAKKLNIDVKQLRIKE